MSKRKGLSAEEKRNKMLQLFYEKKDFFQLKELEKIAPKEKGIIVQSVKDVVQSLVDDGLVDTDKIGTSVYFWAFPSKAKHSRKRKLEELEGKYEEVNQKLKITREELNSYKQNDKESKEKTDLLSEIAELRTKKGSLLSQIQKHEDNDPGTFDKMKKSSEAIKEAVNRWTDNIHSVKKWCQNKFMIEEETLNKQFGISPDLDYID